MTKEEKIESASKLMDKKRILDQMMLASRVLPNFDDRTIDDAWCDDHSQKSPDELEQLFDELIFEPEMRRETSRHQLGAVVKNIIGRMNSVCQTLVAAMLYHTWSGGRVGFAHLPNPRLCDYDEYVAEGDDLSIILRRGTNGDPLRVLTNADREFFLSLPESFTIYRGGAGIDKDMLGAGMCWTTNRNTAEWFAVRSSSEGCPPVLVSARIRKSEVLLSRASEFEIVCAPLRYRTLKCRHQRCKNRSWRPKHTRWSAEMVPNVAA